MTERPLYALKNGQVDVAHMFIECGADVMTQNNYGETPLHLAMQWGQVDVARMLIEHGADAAQNNDGKTLLHLVLQEGEVVVTRMLLECSVDLTGMFTSTVAVQ